LNRNVLRDAAIVLGVALLYVACARLGFAFAYRAAQVTTVWPATGFAVAAVFRFRGRAAIGVFLGAFIANATANEPIAVAGAIAAGNTLEAFLAATILRRVGFDARLRRVFDVLALIAALIAAPVLSATIGVIALTTGRVQPVSAFPDLWWIWWIGDLLGGMTVGAPLLVWSAPGPIARRRKVIAEAAALMAIVFIICAIVFSLPARTASVAHAVYVLFIWAALRLGPASTSTAVLVASVAAILGTNAGLGPFAGAGPEGGLVMLQFFMGVATTTALTLAAVAAQNQDAQRRAELSEARLLMAMNAGGISVWDRDVRAGDAPYAEAIHADDRDRVEEAIRRSVETRTPYNEVFRVVGPDGAEEWVDSRGEVVGAGDGEPERLIGVGIDITRQKLLEEALRGEAKKKDEFLAMLAHELRNPLAPILHAVELLDRNSPASDVIRRQTRHLSRLVDDLLDVSRISSGKVRLEKRRVALEEIVTSGVEMWGARLKQRRQHVSIDLPAETLWLDADPARMIQVLANLIHNASKFTPEGGTITITARKEEGWVVIRVRDTGVGMTPEILEKAFDLFVQGPPPLDRPHGGLGLGLTLVRQLVDLHGGTVTASSAGRGRGSEFTIRLPAASAPAPVVEPVPQRPSMAAHRKIMIVEDNADARDVLMFMLRRIGHDVRAVGDGPSALVEAAKFEPEIVLLDIGLPNMDGYELARRLRAMPQTASAALVAITGYGQAEDRDRARAAGIDHHLLKPVEPAALAELIGRV
jgi:signal transduction histidine kinase